MTMASGGGPIPQVGVQLVANGLPGFTNALDSAKKQVGGFGQSMNALSAPFDFTMAKSVALGAILANVLVSAFNQATAAMKNAASAAIDTAARYMELKEVAQLMGKQQGKTKEEVDALIASIREKGITASQAADLITQFTRYELDLAKASDLARVAQDAGVLTGQDSSETLGRLLWGIQTYNTETLRTVGITIRGDQAMNEYAQSIGKTAATLTSSERSQAMMNAILAEGAKIAGSYEAAMETPGKQMRSFKRVLDDLLVALGTPFMKAYWEFATGLTNITKTFTKASEEGGKLYPILQTLGGTVAGLISGFRYFAEQAAKSLVDWLSSSGSEIKGFIDKLLQFASEAVNYGFQLIANFAQGIALAIQNVLVPVITSVANMIAFFFAPGSPPRIAPKIDVWGKKTLEEWLKGFTEADFGILNSIQKPIQTALGFLVAAGKMDKKKSSKLFAEWTRQIAAMIKTGTVSNSFIKELTQTLGDNGSQVAKLVKLYLKYSKGMREAIRAQERLKELSKVQDELVDKASKLQDEYNELVDAGADPTVLKAKRDEIIATQVQIKANEKEAKALERKIKEAERANAPLREQIQLQEQILSQLNQITQATIEANQAGRQGKDVGGGITPEKEKKQEPVPIKPEAGERRDTKFDEPMTPFEKAMSDAKLAVTKIMIDIKKKWDELWAAPDADKEGGPLYQAQQSLTTIRDTLTSPGMTGAFQTIGDLVLKLSGVFARRDDVLFLFIGMKIATVIAGIASAVSTGVPIMTALMGALGVSTLMAAWPVVLLGLAFFALFWAIKTYGKDAWNTILMLGTIIKFGFNSFIQLIADAWNAFVGALGSIGNALAGAWNAVVSWAGGVVGSIENAFNEAVAKVQYWMLIVDAKVNDFFTRSKIGWDNFWRSVGEKISGAWNNIKAKISGLIGKIATGFTSSMDRLKSIGKNIVDGIKDGISEAWNDVVEFVTGGIETLIENIKKLLKIESPSRVMAREIGEPFAAGIAKGIGKGMKLVESTLGAGLETSIKPVISASVLQGRAVGASMVQSTTNYNLSVSTTQQQQSIERSFELMRLLSSG